jgi:hypothetical protein
MQIAIDDKCKEVFKQLKFEKLYRYIIYKIEGERIVMDETHRLSINTESEIKHGTSSSIACPRMSTGLASSIWNSRPTMGSTRPKSSSATG